MGSAAAIYAITVIACAVGPLVTRRAAVGAADPGRGAVPPGPVADLAVDFSAVPLRDAGHEL